MVEKKGYSVEDRIFDMYIKNSGKNLTSLEQCELFKRLLNRGYSYSEIATKIGKSEVYIREMEKVANAPKEVKNLINEDKISVSLVSDLQKITNEEEIVDVIKPVLDKKQGKKVTKKDFKEVIQEKSPKKSNTNEEHLNKLSELENILIDMDSEKVSIVQELKKFLTGEIQVVDFSSWLNNF